jgi:hypothetical protein
MDLYRGHHTSAEQILRLWSDRKGDSDKWKTPKGVDPGKGMGTGKTIIQATVPHCAP